MPMLDKSWHSTCILAICRLFTVRDLVPHDSIRNQIFLIVNDLYIWDVLCVRLTLCKKHPREREGGVEVVVNFFFL